MRVGTQLRGVTVLATGLALSACAGNSHGPMEDMSPRMVRAAEVSGDAATNSGQPAAAASLYERGYMASPSAEMATRWGRALRQSNQAQAGVVNLKEAARRFPRNAALLTELGRCAAAGGYSQEAGDAYQRAMHADGTGWPTYMAYGAFQAQSGRADEAHALFEQAQASARSDRERYASQANLALLRAQSGDLTGGIADMQAVVAHPGVDARAHGDMALLYGLAGNTAGYNREIAQSGLDSATSQQVSTWLDGADSDEPERAAPRTHAALAHPVAHAGAVHGPMHAAIHATHPMAHAVVVSPVHAAIAHKAGAGPARVLGQAKPALPAVKAP